jgi:16S rRNA (adenine1518-N6/adenine1519-N6)-dimethyltransferase
LTSSSSSSGAARQGRGKRQTRTYRSREVRDAGIRPRKSLGQHFLTDYGVVNRIVAAVEAGLHETLIEVGPGLGALTERLAEVSDRLIAVEIDAEAAARLRERFAGNPGVSVVERDVLAAEPSEYLGEAGAAADTAYGVVGNLPYNAGAAIVRHFLESTRPPRQLVVMLQREVADSMACTDGRMSLLGVSVQVYATVRKLFNVPPRAFYPAPKVTSGVIRLDVRDEPLIEETQREAFFRVARAGFSAPRKQLKNTLAQGLGLTGAEAGEAIGGVGIDPSLRPQDVPLEGWLRLAQLLNEAEG